MASNSAIEWTQSTWNPVVGCTRASAGCDHCYAFTMTKRLAAMGQQNYMGLAGNGHFNGVVRALPTMLDVPMRRKKPTTYFVNSMSDLFHKAVPDDFIDQVFAVMASCPQHTFQILTKRADRMSEYMCNLNRLENIYAQWYSVSDQAPCAEAWPLPNVWLGVSVENQEAANKRIPELLRVPAAVRFLSCEPLLGPVNLELIPDALYDAGMPFSWNKLGGDERGIKWIIAGGESGPNARPMHPEWVRSLRNQCQAANVPFFFKQWGEWITAKGLPASLPIGHVFDDGYQMIRLGKKAAGRLLDGVEWNQFPAVTA